MCNSTQIKNWLDQKVDCILEMRKLYEQLDKPLSRKISTCGFDKDSAGRDCELFIFSGIRELARVAGCEITEDTDNSYRNLPEPRACMMFMYRDVKVFQLCNIDKEGNIIWDK